MEHGSRVFILKSEEPYHKSDQGVLDAWCLQEYKEKRLGQLAFEDKEKRKSARNVQLRKCRRKPLKLVRGSRVIICNKLGKYNIKGEIISVRDGESQRRSAFVRQDWNGHVMLRNRTFLKMDLNQPQPDEAIMLIVSKKVEQKLFSILQYGLYRMKIRPNRNQKKKVSFDCFVLL